MHNNVSMDQSKQPAASIFGVTIAPNQNGDASVSFKETKGKTKKKKKPERIRKDAVAHDKITPAVVKPTGEEEATPEKHDRAFALDNWDDEMLLNQTRSDVDSSVARRHSSKHPPKKQGSNSSLLAEKQLLATRSNVLSKLRENTQIVDENSETNARALQCEWREDSSNEIEPFLSQSQCPPLPQNEQYKSRRDVGGVGLDRSPAQEAPRAPWDDFCDEEELTTVASRQQVNTGIEYGHNNEEVGLLVVVVESEEHLVTANLVGDQPLVVATPETWLRRHQWWLTGGLVVLIVMSILAIVFSVVDLNSNQYPPTMAPTTMMQGIMSDTADIMGTSLPTVATALLDESTPQFAALQWVSERQLAKNEPYTILRLIQLYSLATLYYSTTISTSWIKFDGWLVEKNECIWYGVKCNDAGLVAALLLTDNGLNGTLPPDLALLSNHLSAVDLANNSISGPIPQEYEHLSGLRYLTLHKNMIDSSIPSDLFNHLDKLEYLDLSDNALQSTIPTSIGKLFALQSLLLKSNGFIGSLPTEVGRLRQLEELIIDDNGLAAPLPSEIGQLTRLNSLQAMNNSLLGPIPSEIGLLESLKLFDISHNSVFNIIPSELGSMRQLTHLDWSHNLFTGTLPSSLNQLTQLRLLRLGNNFLESLDLRLEGEGFQIFGPMSASLVDLDLSQNFFRDITLPPDFSSLSKLTSLRLEKSGLAGSIASLIGRMTDLERLNLSGLNQGIVNSQSLPSEIGLLTKLKEFHMHSSDLEGSIPSEISFLTDLELIDLRDNSLSGSISSMSVRNMKRLTVLDLSENELTSTIPSDLRFLTDLSFLNLATNLLSGPIPTEVGLLQSLYRMLLFDNLLSSTIPSELGRLSRLVDLDFNLNSMTGSIPSEIGLLSALERMIGRTNPSLSGTLPSNLGQLAQLSMLSLDATSIFGTLPSEIGLLQNLTHLIVFRTKINGKLPSEIGRLTDLSVVDLHYTELSGTVPSEIGSLRWMKRLDLSETTIKGDLPSELGLLGNLVDLILSNTAIAGTLLTEIGSMTSLSMLDLSHTALIGTLPSELGQLESLQSAWLSYTGLTGTLPSNMGTLTNMMRLILSPTGVSGTVPTEFGNLSSLRILTLVETSITGSIPFELCELPPPFPYGKRDLVINCQEVRCDCCGTCPDTSPPTLSLWPSGSPSSSNLPTNSLVPTSKPSMFPNSGPTTSASPSLTVSPSVPPSGSFDPTTSAAPPLLSVMPIRPVLPSSSSPRPSVCSYFSSIAEVGYKSTVTFNGTSPTCDYNMLPYSLYPFSFQYLGKAKQAYGELCPSDGTLWLTNRVEFFIEIMIADFEGNQLCCGNIYYHTENEMYILSWEGWTIVDDDSTTYSFDFQCVLHTNGNIEFRWGGGKLPPGTAMSSAINVWSAGFQLPVFDSLIGSGWPANQCRMALATDDGLYTILA